MKFLRAFWFWVVIVMVSVVYFAAAVPAYALTRILSPKNATHVMHWFACAWAKTIFSLNPGWRLSVEGREYLEKERATVYVANHQSAGDICAMLCLGTRFRWLSKHSMFKVPILGQAMKLAGYVSVVRGNPVSHKRALEQSANWLRNGVSMAFFPEGSRSEDGRLKPFKPGAFRLAESVDVDVVPIAITGTKEMVRKGSLLPDKSHVRLTILPPQKRRDDESMDAFMTRVRGQIEQQLHG